MSFMKPETYNGDYYEIETPGGTTFLPWDVHPGATTLPELSDYFEHTGDPEYWSLTIKSGWLGRYSAPGYMDATDWMPGDDEASLLAEMAELYGDDDESDDQPIIDGWESIDTSVEEDRDGDALGAVLRHESAIRERFGLKIVDGNETGMCWEGTAEQIKGFTEALGATVGFHRTYEREWHTVKTADGTEIGQINPSPDWPNWLLSGTNAPMIPILDAMFPVPPEVPNLDTMDVAELHAFAGSIPTQFPESVRSLLYRYCMVRADAALNLQSGQIESTKRLDREADAIYQELPTEYRW